MADIFISYSHPDRAAARELAAWLEAQGYSVWWDTKLGAGDDFQLEIHKELGPARAVIVLWSAASTKSTWVRAEAAAAQRDSKLIPVKLSGTAYEDIVQPFNLLHTEDVANKELIRAAVQAQLDKPAPAPRFVKQLKYEALMWFGIIGSAITVFTSLDSIIKLANWAQWLSYYWVSWTAEFWAWIAKFFGLRFPKEMIGIFNSLFFIISITVFAIYNRESNKIVESKHYLSFSYATSVLATIFIVSQFLFIWITAIFKYGYISYDDQGYFEWTNILIYFFGSVILLVCVEIFLDSSTPQQRIRRILNFAFIFSILLFLNYLSKFGFDTKPSPLIIK